MERLTNAISQNWCRTLFTIFVAAFVIRLGFILTLQDGFYFPDSVIYSEAAVNLLTNGELGNGYDRPPGYAAFLAAVHVIFGESIRAIRIVESFIGAFLAVMIAVIARRIAGESVGALAGLLWTIHPMGIFIAGLVYPTSLLAMLLAGGFLYLLPEAQEDFSSKRVFLAGLLGGLAALTIPIVLATMLAISMCLIYWGSAQRFLLAGLLFLGTATAVVPWAIRDFYVYDRLVLIEPRLTQHLPQMRTAEEKIRDNRVQAILTHPGEFAARFGREFSHFWQLYPDRIAMDRPGFRERTHQQYRQVVKDTIFTTNTLITTVSILSTGPLFFFAIIGTAAMFFRSEQRRELSLIWATILSFAIGYSIFVAKMRYRIPVEPYIIILAAHGMIMTACMVARSFAYGLGAPHTRRYDPPKEA